MLPALAPPEVLELAAHTVSAVAMLPLCCLCKPLPHLLPCDESCAEALPMLQTTLLHPHAICCGASRLLLKAAEGAQMCCVNC